MIRILVLFVCLVSLALGDTVSVRNKPFPGKVDGKGAEVYVELAVLVKLLDAGQTSRDGGWVVTGPAGLSVDSTAVRQKGDLVHLGDFAKAAGARLVVSSELSSVDYYPQPKKAEPDPTRGLKPAQVVLKVIELTTVDIPATPEDIDAWTSATVDQAAAVAARHYLGRRPYLSARARAECDRELADGTGGSFTFTMGASESEVATSLRNPFILGMYLEFMRIWKRSTWTVVRESIEGDHAVVDLTAREPGDKVPGKMHVVLVNEFGGWKVDSDMILKLGH